MKKILLSGIAIMMTCVFVLAQQPTDKPKDAKTDKKEQPAKEVKKDTTKKECEKKDMKPAEEKK